jgi:signal transduction histidine kinase
MLHSLRARITATFTAAIAILLLLVCGALVLAAWRNASRQADASLRETLDRVRTGIVREGEEDPSSVVPSEVLRDIGRESAEARIAVTITDGAGRVWNGPGRILPATAMREATTWRVATMRVNGYTVAVGLHWAEAEAPIRSLALLLLCLSGVAVLATGLGAWFLVGRTLSPIDQLSYQAQSVSVETPHVALSAPSPDAEVVRLVTTLNDLLARSARATAAKGRFYAAASHELRTPLQVLTGRIELTLGKPRTNEEYRAALHELQGQADRLSALIQSLLTLNRLEAAGASPPPERVVLADVCERALASFAPAIRERRLRVCATLPADVSVVAPTTFVDMLVFNLIENAVKYATPGGMVRIEAEAMPDAPQELRIFNECAPLTIDRMEQLFEPFYRPDSARNAKTGGNGLGLAICKSIVLSEGWKLTLEQITTESSRGVRAVVVFDGASA